MSNYNFKDDWEQSRGYKSEEDDWELSRGRKSEEDDRELSRRHKSEEDYLEYSREHECEEECTPPTTQTHVHEILGSVKLAEEGDDRHNHRFATVSSEVIPLKCGGHKHVFSVNTDFLDHHHEVAGETGPAICVGNGKHVHFAYGNSTIDDGHYHKFQFATLINSPLLPQ